MPLLVIQRGPNAGKEFPLDGDALIIGRQPDCAIWLESTAVSRQHAQVVCRDSQYFVEDLGSSNGTYLNGKRIEERASFTEEDTLQIGPYAFALRPDAPPPPAEAADEGLVIREQVNATPTNQSLYNQNPAHKLQVVLEISQHLARTLEVEPLLDKLLDQLLRLFPQADRAIVLLSEKDRLFVRGQRCRGEQDPTHYSYSRTIVKQALENGVGILSEDVRADQRFSGSATLVALNLRSLLCVPLISPEGGRLGVIQIDRSRAGTIFTSDDLQLLTAVGLQVAVVLENVALHEKVLREERLRQELALAREIQQGFLPTDFPTQRDSGFDLYARVYPAREVSGDLYDFFGVSDGRLAFFLGDVSGKGMPAALFMVAVRTLCRHLASEAGSPAETLRKLNAALAAVNPSAMFVTLAHGLYDPRTGEIVFASGGHPLPLLRRPDGRVEELAFPTGRLLGYAEGNLGLADTRLFLAPGETLILYTDGFTEACAPDGETMFEVERLQQVLGGPRITALPLEACAVEAKAAVEHFTGSTEQQDDMTLLLLRRVAEAGKHP